MMRAVEPLLSKGYRWLTHKLYDQLAWAYDGVSWLVSGGQWARWRALALEKPLGRTVLEIGFGPGHLLADLRARGHTVVGLDPSPAMHRVAAARLTSSGAGAFLVIGQAQHLPFRDGSFDTIVMTFPAEFLLDPATMVECARTTRRVTSADHNNTAALVASGIWVEVTRPWIAKLLPVFYGRPPQELLDVLLEQAAMAGLRAGIDQDQLGRVRIGSIVAYHQKSDQLADTPGC